MPEETNKSLNLNNMINIDFPEGELFKEFVNGDSSEPFNYRALAKELKASSNLYTFLKDLSIPREVNPLIAKTAADEDSERILDPDSERNIEEIVERRKKEENLSDENEEINKDNEPTEISIDRSGKKPRVQQEDLPDIMERDDIEHENDNSEEFGEKQEPIVRNKPTGNKLENLIIDSNGKVKHSVNVAHTLVGDALRIFNKKDGSSDSLIHELSGVKDKEGVSDPDNLKSDPNFTASKSIASGLNRALNIFKKTKKPEGYTPDDMLTDMATYLSSNIRKELDDYRHSSNVRGFEEKGTPQKRVPTRNHSYIEISYPKKDERLGNDKDVQDLKESLESFAKNGIAGDNTSSVKIRIVDNTFASGSNPLGGNASVAMVESVGSHQFVDETELREAEYNARRRTSKKEDKVKTANDLNNSEGNRKLYPKARSFLSETSTLIDFENKEKLESLLFKWYCLMIKDSEIHTSNENLNNALRGIKSGSSSEKEFESWLKSRSPIFNFSENKIPLGSATDVRVDTATLEDVLSAIKATVEKNIRFSADRIIKAIKYLKSNKKFDADAILTSRMPVLLTTLANDGTLNIGESNNVLDVLSTSQSEESLSEQDAMDIASKLLKHAIGGEFTTENFRSVEVSDLEEMLKKWRIYIGRIDQAAGTKFNNPKNSAEELFNYIKESDKKGVVVSYLKRSILLWMMGNFENIKKLVPQSKPVLTPEDYDKTEYLYTVYATGSVKGPYSARMEPITLSEGSEYELVWGPYSTGSGILKKNIEKEDLNKETGKAFDSLILKVKDGRPIVDKDQARLGENEIAKFIEFVAREFAEKAKTQNENTFSIDSETGVNPLDLMTSDQKDTIEDSVSSGDYHENLIKGLSSMGIEDIAKTLRKIRETKDSYVNRVHGKYFGKQKENVKKYILENKDSDIDNMIHQVSKSLSKNLPSIKSSVFSSSETPDFTGTELLHEVMNSREVSEKYLENLLSNESDIGIALNQKAKEGIFYDALEQVIKDNHLEKYLTTNKKDKILSTRKQRDTSLIGIDDFIKKAFSHARKSENKEWAKLWVEAWKSLPDKDKFFTKDHGFSFNTQFLVSHDDQKKSPINKEELTEIAKAILRGKPSSIKERDEHFDNLKKIPDFDKLVDETNSTDGKGRTISLFTLKDDLSKGALAGFISSASNLLGEGIRNLVSGVKFTDGSDASEAIVDKSEKSKISRGTSSDPIVGYSLNLHKAAEEGTDVFLNDLRNLLLNDSNSANSVGALLRGFNPESWDSLIRGKGSATTTPISINKDIEEGKSPKKTKNVLFDLSESALRKEISEAMSNMADSHRISVKSNKALAKVLTRNKGLGPVMKEWSKQNNRMYHTKDPIGAVKIVLSNADSLFSSDIDNKGEDSKYKDKNNRLKKKIAMIDKWFGLLSPTSKSEVVNYLFDRLYKYDRSSGSLKKTVINDNMFSSEENEENDKAVRSSLFNNANKNVLDFIKNKVPGEIASNLPIDKDRKEKVPNTLRKERKDHDIGKKDEETGEIPSEEGSPLMEDPEDSNN